MGNKNTENTEETLEEIRNNKGSSRASFRCDET